MATNPLDPSFSELSSHDSVRAFGKSLAERYGAWTVDTFETSSITGKGTLIVSRVKGKATVAFPYELPESPALIEKRLIEYLTLQDRTNG